MSTARTIAKNILSLASAEIGSRILTFVLTVFLARHLGDISFGKYAFALSFTYLFVALIDLGLGFLITREVAKDKSLAGKYLGNASLIRLISSVAVFLLIVVMMNLMHYPRETTIAVYILGAYVILGSVNVLFRSIFRAFERMEYDAMVHIIERVLLFGLVMSLIHLGYGLIEIVVVFPLSAVFGLVLSIFLVTRKFAKPKFELDFGFWKEAIKEAWPFALIAVFATVYFRIDMVILSAMKGDAAVGWYNAACNVVFGLILIPQVVHVSLFPVLSRYFQSSRDSAIKLVTLSFKYLIIVGFPIAIGTTLLAPRIISLLYGDAYMNGVVVLQILSWVFFVGCLYTILAATLNSINKQRMVALAMGISVVANILLNLLLIPRYNLVGAAIATVTASLFVFVFEFYFINRYAFKTRLFNSDFIKIAISSLVMGVFVFYFHSNLLLVIVLAAIIYAALLIASKAFSREDVKTFRELIFGQPGGRT